MEKFKFKKFLYRSQINVLIVSYFWYGAQKENVRKILKIPPAGRYFQGYFTPSSGTVGVEEKDFLASGKKLLLLAKKQNYKLINKICLKFYQLGESFLKFSKNLIRSIFTKREEKNF